MKAGRELDALIAEKVMGWRRMSWKDYHAYMNFMGTDEREEFTYAWHDADGNMTEFHANDKLYYDDPTPPWAPSEEIADAWLVVEQLGKSFDVSRCRKFQEIEAWFWEASFHNGPDAQADTAPLAICLAALKAVKDKP